MPLSDTAVRSAKPADKPYKLPDEKGLFLLVHPNGALTRLIDLAGLLAFGNLAKFCQTD